MADDDWRPSGCKLVNDTVFRLLDGKHCFLKLVASVANVASLHALLNIVTLATFRSCIPHTPNPRSMRVKRDYLRVTRTLT
jgi:hypothetical protein